jgi:hypothetical protein
MKKSLLTSLLLLTALLTVFLQCSNDQNTSPKNVQFTLSVPRPDDGGRIKSFEEVESAMVTISDNHGTVIHDRAVIEVLSFGEMFITKPLSLAPGSYTIDEFLLLDSDNDILYATPLHGSPLAELVENPLPSGFSVSQDEITNVPMEVVSTEYQQPEDFGFVSFNPGVINAFQIAVYEISESGAMLIEAEASLLKDGEVLRTWQLGAKVNLIGIPGDDSEAYVLSVTKGGYTTFSKSFTVDSLKSELNGDPLVVHLVAVTGDQTEVILHPGVEGKDAQIGACVPCGYNTANVGNSTELAPIAWTNGGDLSVIRGLLEFDLSSIPANATVTSAKLSLYHFTSVGNGDHSSLTHPNVGFIERITESWQEGTVTWDTQPATTAMNRVNLPESESPTQDYTDLDVTNMIQDMINDPASGHGFMLRMQNEAPYCRLIFASSDNANSDLHPKLVVTYSVD